MIQKKKEYLRSYMPLTHEIHYLEEQIQESRVKNRSSRVQNYDNIGRSGKISDVSDALTKEERLLRKWIDTRTRKVQRCSEIYFRVEEMESQDEKTVLIMHYLQRLSFEKIAEKMGYSLRQIYRIHGMALEHFNFPEEEEAQDGSIEHGSH